jgi:hypothetical protein
VTNDVEKRWHDPAAMRSAVRYAVAVVAVAAVAFVACLLIDRHSLLLASITPAVLLAGGIGAFVKTYRVWRARGTWPIWQGAGWFLLTLMLVSLSLPGSAAMS